MIRVLAGAGGAAVAGVLAVAVLVAAAAGAEEDAAAATPAAGTAAGMCTAVPAGEIAGFSGDQLANAGVIVREGQRLGVPERGLVVAVATAMQESTLRAVDYGDIMPNGRMSSSRGLFQQLAAWGSLPDRLDAARSAVLFYTGGRAGQPGLLDIPGWEAMSVAAAAQAVQRSETPTAYAQWEPPARDILAAVRGSCGEQTTEFAGAAPVAVAAEGSAQVAIDRALSQLGVPYAWGGGDAHGPTLGIRDGGVADAHSDYAKVGFDCSGLALFAYAGIGVAVPHQTKAIWAAYPHLTDRGSLLPGDLLLYSDNGQVSGIHHVSIYLGEDRMVEAPQSGQVVKISEGIWSGFRGSEFIGAVRPS